MKTLTYVVPDNSGDSERTFDVDDVKAMEEASALFTEFQKNGRFLVKMGSQENVLLNRFDPEAGTVLVELKIVTG